MEDGSGGVGGRRSAEAIAGSSPPVSPRLAGAVLLLSLTAGTGCFRHHVIDAEGIRRLHGYDGSGETTILDDAGFTVPFGPEAPLTLVLRDGSRVVRRYLEIHIKDGWFLGRTDRDEMVEVHLSDVERLYASVRQRARVLSIVAGSFATAVVLVLALILVFG